MYQYFYKLFILTLSSELLFTFTKCAPKGSVVSFSIPRKCTNSVCVGTDKDRINKKLILAKGQQTLLKRQVNAINIHRYVKCSCEIDTPEKLQSKMIPNILNAYRIKPEHFEDRMIRTIIKRLGNQIHYSDKNTGKTYMKQLKDVIKHDTVPSKISANNQKRFLKADNTFGKSGIRNFKKRSYRTYGDKGIIENREYIMSKFEQIEHDMETLANGISVLHDNMFEYKDIKKQFSQEKTRMENNILQKLRSEYNVLNMKVEYTSNQLQIVSDLLHATAKSQKDLQTKIQNFNATFNLKSYKTDMNILEIASRLDALNETISQNGTDILKVSDTKQKAYVEDAIMFVSNIKTMWPILIENVTALSSRENELFKILNRSLENHELEDDIDNRHTLRHECNNAGLRCFGFNFLEIFIVTISVLYNNLVL